MSFARFSILFLLLSYLSLLVVAIPECGYIFDGAKPLVDIDRQSDTTRLHANWYGFFGVVGGSTGGSTGGSSTGSTGGVIYPFPITSAGSSTGLSSSTGGSTGGSTGRNSELTYQVAIISEKLANVSAIQRSGPDAETSDRCRSGPGFKGKPDVQAFKTVQPSQIKSKQGFFVDLFESTRLKLNKNEMYWIVLRVSGRGKTIYTNTDGIRVGVSGSGSDDDDEFPPYKAGLIAMGIAICCLLVLLCLLILVAKGKGEDKYTTTVHRNENVDKL